MKASARCAGILVTVFPGRSGIMGRYQPVDVELDAEQQAESERIFSAIRGAFEEEAQRLAKLMASKQTKDIFGQTEFEVRDRVHALGAHLLEATAAERVKKGGLSGS
jgi:hypothetical protein